MGMIYADYNATTPLCASAFDAMKHAFERWGNPSSTHKVGRDAKELLEQSRELVASCAGADPRNIVFTSGGSEANTMALMGMYLNHPKDFRLLTSPIEHSSVRGTVKLFRQLGVEIEMVGIRACGEIDLEDLEKKIVSFKPHLVSIMAANNETGIINPVPDMAKICKAAKIPFHTDCVQALGKMDPSHWKDADMASISGHKVYGPKGVGALIIKHHLKLEATHFGGPQETRRRGGTENVAGIAGFGGACAELSCDFEKVRKLRDRFEALLKKDLTDFQIQGQDLKRTPNTTNLRIKGVQAEVLLSAFDLDGLCVSAGSACASGSLSASPVIQAMGLTPEESKESLRFSWGCPTTQEEVEKAAEIVVSHVKRIRSRRTARR